MVPTRAGHEQFKSSRTVLKFAKFEQMNRWTHSSLKVCEQVNRWTHSSSKVCEQVNSELLFFESLFTSEQVNSCSSKVCELVNKWTHSSSKMCEQVNRWTLFFSVQCPAIFSLQTFEQMYLNFFVNYWIYEQDYVISGTWESMI